MDTPSSFIPHEHPFVDVEDVLICWVISPAFFPVMTGCSVCVYGNNLGLQAT